MNSTRYSRVAMLLHWLIAAALAFQYGLGEQFAHLPRGKALFDTAQFHKSIGITILVLSFVRLLVRFTKQRPSPLADHGWAERLASITHWGLYAFMIGAPVTGWLATSSSGFNMPTYLFNAIPWPDFPFVVGLEEATKHNVHDFAEVAHGVIAKLGLLLFLLHVAGALRHQWILKEALVERMLPVSKALPRALGTGLIIALAAGFFALMQLGESPGIAPSAGSAPFAPPRNEGVTPAGNTKLIVDEHANHPHPDKAEPPKMDASEPGEGDELPATTKEAEKISAVDANAIKPGEMPNWAVTRGGTLRFASGWSGIPVDGSFSRWDAVIAFNPDTLSKSRIRVPIDLASANSGDDQRDAMLTGSDFFNVAAFPKAVWTSSSISALGGNRYRADGTLSLRGATQPVPLIFTLDIKGKEAHAVGSASFKRLSFGVGQGDYAKTDEIPDGVKVGFDFRAWRS